VTEQRIRALREGARRSRGRLAEYSPRRLEGAGPAANRRASLERSSRRAAAQLAAAVARRNRAAAGSPPRTPERPIMNPEHDE
jgi:hypothetical protein